MSALWEHTCTNQISCELCAKTSPSPLRNSLFDFDLPALSKLSGRIYRAVFNIGNRTGYRQNGTWIYGMKIYVRYYIQRTCRSG
jgi:hypothetical protein